MKSFTEIYTEVKKEHPEFTKEQLIAEADARASKAQKVVKKSAKEKRNTEQSGRSQG